MGIEYKGDINSAGETGPFPVAVRDDVSPKVKEQLEETNGIVVTENFKIAKAVLIRGATRFPDKESFSKWPELMLACRVGVGVDNIDMKSASEAGVATINTPGASTEAVATRALTFMLAWAARLHEGREALKESRWPKGDPDVEPKSLKDMTLGIVGYGRIGRETAAKAMPFFGKTIYFDPLSKDGSVPLKKLLAESDVISVHASGDNEVLTNALLENVRSGSLIVNTSHGGVINAQGLLRAMERGVDAALDVFPQENAKMFEDKTIAAITQHPRFIGTPHTAASDVFTQTKLGLEGAEYATRFANRGEVNRHNLQGHTLPALLTNDPLSPGVRAILTHQSVKGAIANISDIVRQEGKSISQFCNEQGRSFGDSPLAITAFDLEDTTPDQALNIINSITKVIPILRKRLLYFENIIVQDEE